MTPDSQPLDQTIFAAVGKGKVFNGVRQHYPSYLECSSQSEDCAAAWSCPSPAAGGRSPWTGQTRHLWTSRNMYIIILACSVTEAMLAKFGSRTLYLERRHIVRILDVLDALAALVLAIDWSVHFLMKSRRLRYIFARSQINYCR